MKSLKKTLLLILALALVMAMLLSCMLMLTSCPDSGDDGPDNGGSQVDGELNLDEGVNGSQGIDSDGAGPGRLRAEF